jgi:hypothetical protein
MQPIFRKNRFLYREYIFKDFRVLPKLIFCADNWYKYFKNILQRAFSLNCHRLTTNFNFYLSNNFKPIFFQQNSQWSWRRFLYQVVD